jgi:hypothetical protein
MDYYFMVLQLPGGEGSTYSDDDIVQKNFWAYAIRCIENGTANLVCLRQDTGVAETLRQHFYGKDFTIYLLFHLLLTPAEAADENTLFKKAVDIINTANYEAVVDADDNFQLIVIDRLDVNSLKVNFNAG